MIQLKTYVDPRTMTEYPEAVARIIQCNVSYATQTAQVCIGYYKSVEDANANLRCLCVFNFDIQPKARTDVFGADIPTFFDLFAMEIFEKAQTNPKRVIYEWLDKHPLFEGGKKV